MRDNVWIDILAVCPNEANKVLGKVESIYIERYGLPSYRQSTYAIKVIVANLVYMLKHSYNRLYVSRDVNTYRKVVVNGNLISNGIGITTVTKILDMLEDEGWIESTRGFRFVEDNGVVSNKSGYVVLTAKGVDMIIENTDMSLVKGKTRKNVLVLKDSKGKHQEFDDTPVVVGMVDTVTKYNDYLSHHTVMYHNTTLNTSLVRVFNRGDQTFKYGGRFYADGHNYQSLSGNERRTITINGEGVYELDFRSIHISIYCAREGLRLPEGYDVYSLYDESHYEIDADKVEMVTNTLNAVYNPYREFQKVVWLIMINCGSKDRTSAQNRRSAINAINAKLIEDREQPLLEQKFCGLSSVDVEAVVDFITEKFHFLSELLYSDAGIELMKDDSDIMEGILLSCMEKNIPVLAVHDSVVCPQSKLADVMQIMRLAYSSVVGSEDNCVITVK